MALPASGCAAHWTSKSWRDKGATLGVPAVDFDLGVVLAHTSAIAMGEAREQDNFLFLTRWEKTYGCSSVLGKTLRSTPRSMREQHLAGRKGVFRMAALTPSRKHLLQWIWPQGRT